MIEITSTNYEGAIYSLLSIHWIQKNRENRIAIIKQRYNSAHKTKNTSTQNPKIWGEKGGGGGGG